MLGLTAQAPVNRWHEVIGYPTLADAILDRIVHRAHRIELKGPSLRPHHIVAESPLHDRPWPIAHGDPQRLPWTPWTIRSRLDRPQHAHATPKAFRQRRGALRPSRRAWRPVISVITITGFGNHLRPEWPITFINIRIAFKPEEKMRRGQRI